MKATGNRVHRSWWRIALKHFHCSLYFGILAASAAAFGQQQSPAPTIVSLFPNAVVAGNQGFSLRVDGTRFTQSSRVVWRPGAIGAANLTTTFVSENVLTAVVPAGLLEQAGSIPLVVTQPGDFGSTVSSGEAIFTVVAGMTLPTACPLPTLQKARASWATWPSPRSHRNAARSRPSPAESVR